jgi:hypothetical protein
MASGTIYGAFTGESSSRVRPYVTYSQTNDASANTSDITVNLYFQSISAYHGFGTCNPTYTRISSLHNHGAIGFNVSAEGTDHIVSRTATVSHDADGNLSIALGADGTTNIYWGSFGFQETKTMTANTRNCAVSTSSASSIGGTSATVGGNVTDAGLPRASTRGIHWGTSSGSLPNWIASGSGAGAFNVNITGLARGTTYYFRAGAYNTSYGWRHGSTLSFTTTAAAPSVTTGSASSITYNSASVSGNVTNANGATVTTRGICYNTTGTPTTSSPKVASGSGTGSFSSSLTGLDPDQLYYARAYATNSKGTSYGVQISFTTLSAEPTVTTTAGATGITTSAATVAGNVTSDNGATITERGFCYSNTETTPTTSNSKAITTGTTGAMSKEITGLSIGTKYYFRAYAINSRGTGYGTTSNFTTQPGDPSGLVATTNDKDEVGLTWTKGNGGTYTIIRRGETAPSNINSGDLVYQGTGTSYTNTGLDSGTTYYYRAWAATTADWSEAYSDSYSASYTTTTFDFEDPEDALVDDVNPATVPANDAKLYCQVSRDGGATWSMSKEITVSTVATQSFGDGTTELWGMLTWNGGHMSDANFQVKLTGGSEGKSYQIYKTFGFSINSDYQLTGVQVQVKAAWDNVDLLVYFVKADAYYGTSTLPVTAGSLAYNTDDGSPTFYDGTDWNSIWEVVYPVGSIYISTASTSPETLFGGTWSAVGEGRVLVGKASSGTFDTAGATGGSESHSHTVDSHRHSIAQHSHTVDSHRHSVAQHSHTVNSHSHGDGSFKAAGGAVENNTGAWGYQATSAISGVSYTYAIGASVIAKDHVNHSTPVYGTSSSSSPGTNTAGTTYTGYLSPETNTAGATYTGYLSPGTNTGSNLQPYLVTYMWERTA